MISLAAPIRYDREAGAGRNNPLRVVVETADGEEHDVFLKPCGRAELGIANLAHEALAACIAGSLGLPVCRPFLVELSDDWIGSVHDPALRAQLRHCNPIAFASQAAGAGWAQWSPDDILTAARRPVAVAIFAFDAFVENPDRKPSNPNLLVKGEEFRIIDHELSLFVRGLFPPPTPWRHGYLSHMLEHDRHVFASRLRGTPLGLDDVHAAWAGLSDDELSDYEASLPAQWAEAADAVTAALTHVRTVRDKIDECLVEMERALA